MPKPLLNQIVALVTGKKTTYQKELTAIHHRLKQDQVDGLIRQYKPHDDSDLMIPQNDSKGIAVDLRNTIIDFREKFSEIVDLVATQDVANCKAAADVVVGDAVVLKAVPVTHLLYLEKVLVDMHTFIAGLPVLNPIHKWTYDSQRDCYVTDPVQTTRTAKRKVKFVKAEATDKHPAQVDVYDEDVPVGTWNTTYISTALEAPTQKAYLKRLEELRDAVKKAREIANGIEIDKVQYGQQLVDFIFNE